MQYINITSVGQAAEIWFTISQPRQVIKDSIFWFFVQQESFQKGELEIIENLKNKIKLSGDNDFFEKINKITKRFIFTRATRYEDSTDFERLPDEIKEGICAILSLASLKNLHLVSTRFATLLNDHNYVANFHVRKIDLPKVKYNSKNLFKIIKIYGDRVTSIDSHLIQLDDEQLQSIATCCPNLKSFTIKTGADSPDDGTIKKETLELISSLEHLRSFGLQSYNLTEELINQMCTFTHLQSLDFTGSHIKDEHLLSITKLNNINTLFLNGSRFSKVGLSELVNMTNLRVLSLRATNIGDEELQVLANLKLHSLDLSYAQVKKMKGIEAQTDLRALLLEGTKIDNEAMEKIGLLTKLHILNLDSNPIITKKGLNRISTLTNLEVLNLRRALPQGETVYETLGNTLVKLNKISLLNLNHSQFTNTCFETITHLTDMQDLDLSYTAIDDEGLIRIAHFTSLTRLVLEATSVGDKSIKSITPNLVALDTLNLSSTKVSEAILPDLAKLPVLKTLDLFVNGIDGKSVKKILKVSESFGFNKFTLNSNL